MFVGNCFAQCNEDWLDDFCTEINNDIIQTRNAFKKTIYKSSYYSQKGMTVAAINDSVFACVLYINDKPDRTNYYVVSRKKTFPFDLNENKRTLHNNSYPVTAIAPNTIKGDTTYLKRHDGSTGTVINLYTYDEQGRLKKKLFLNHYDTIITQYQYQGDSITIERVYYVKQSDTVLRSYERNAKTSYNEKGFRADTTIRLRYRISGEPREWDTLVYTRQKRFDRNGYLKEIIRHDAFEKNGTISTFVYHLYIRRRKK